ncbi:MAG TPA: 2-phosphosulfolactate phosphatase [Ktedonobacteraceae bacterium]|nr:2-phosphosulfolactate phosphatase [Ktedonobacteraceae bacterium]
MRLNVFFTPSAIVVDGSSSNDVYIVIDVIRATTSMSVMLDQGAARILVVSTIEEARDAARRVPGRLLCGERNVQPVPGFDYGNSPVQFSQVDLTGRELIMTTTNGTRAFYACPPDTTRLAGSFYNAEAVALKALDIAKEKGGDIHLVCSGELDYFALDDAVCAGFVALELHRLQGEVLPLDLHESVLAAIGLFEAFEPPRVIDHCNSAQAVILGGLPDDPPFCMRTSVSQSVPVVVGKEVETGLLVVERS